MQRNVRPAPRARGTALRAGVVLVPLVVLGVASGPGAGVADAAYPKAGPYRCRSVVVARPGVEYRATAVRSYQHRARRPATCVVIRVMIRRVLIARDESGEGACTQALGGAPEARCEVRVPGSGSWSCVRTSERGQITCIGPRERTAQFNLRDVFPPL